MPSVGKYPNDVARERQDVPETYEQNRETFTKAEAKLERGDDLAAGGPGAEATETETDESPDIPR
jgi:hypothetical protein